MNVVRDFPPVSRVSTLNLDEGTRKLKCSGDLTGCLRCIADGVLCHYSERKTMGRPRKRRREDEGNIFAAMESLEGVGNSANRLDRSQLQSRYLADFASHSSLGMGDLPYSNVGFDMDGYQDDIPDLQIQQSDSLSGYPAWDPAQHSDGDSSCAAKDPTQLQISSSGVGDDNVGGVQTTCVCLPNLYSTLASFQSLPEPSFPYSLGLLKNAVRLGHGVVLCQVCPTTYNTGVQNVMLLGTLVQLILNEYAKLLKHIEQRAANEERIAFRFGEHSTSLDSRHTGTPDCPMGINIDLSGEEWQMLARKAIRQGVLGSSNKADSLVALIDAMKERQQTLHQRYLSDTHSAGHGQNTAKNAPDGGPANEVCLQVTFIDRLRKSLEALQL